MLCWASLIAARYAAGKGNFVLAAVSLWILRFYRYLSCRSRGTDLHLERSVRGDDRFTTATANRRSRFSASADEVKIPAEKFGA